MGTRRSMAKSCLLTCAALTLVPMVLADMAVASETRCVRADDPIRRVAMEVQDPSRDAPCEVVYWKDTEEPGVRSVLWRAQTDAGYCAQKAEELISRLRSVGWSCAIAGEQPRAASREAPPPVAAPSPPANSAEPQVAEDRPQVPSSQGADGRAAAPPIRAALAPPRTTTAPPGDAADPSAGTALDAIIAQNLVHLNDGVDGRFAAEIADYGDLDGDGRDNGLVFFTYGRSASARRASSPRICSTARAMCWPPPSRWRAATTMCTAPRSSRSRAA